MGYLLAAAAISFAVASFFVRQSRRGMLWGADSDFTGPQKFHCGPVPRMGGIGIFAAVAACAAVAGLTSPGQGQMVLLVACGLPVMAYGLAEDVTLAITPQKRLLAAAFSAFLGAILLEAVVVRTELAALDFVLAWSVIAVPLTIFAVAGIANSVNIIDGFNGLASMVSIMMFAAVAYVAYTVGDQFILLTALCCIGALIGFFVWNFPHGMIFLGDGGAYFIGFMLAELTVLLVHRHPQVSPWFAVLLFVYPTVETGFSVYRRRVLKGVPVASPDASHLHSLIFRRLMHSGKAGEQGARETFRNSMTSPYLWVLSSISVIPAAVFWNNTPALVLSSAGFAVIYLWLYRRIVRFRTPLWLFLN